MQNKISLRLFSSWAEHYEGAPAAFQAGIGSVPWSLFTSSGNKTEEKMWMHVCLVVWCTETHLKYRSFLAGGSSLECERSNLVFGLLYYLVHSEEPHSRIRPSKWLAQNKPRARQCLRQTQVFFFSCTLCSNAGSHFCGAHVKCAGEIGYYFCN